MCGLCLSAGWTDHLHHRSQGTSPPPPPSARVPREFRGRPPSVPAPAGHSQARLGHLGLRGSRPGLPAPSAPLPRPSSSSTSSGPRHAQGSNLALGLGMRQSNTWMTGAHTGRPWGSPCHALLGWTVSLLVSVSPLVTGRCWTSRTGRHPFTPGLQAGHRSTVATPPRCPGVPPETRLRVPWLAAPGRPAEPATGRCEARGRPSRVFLLGELSGHANTLRGPGPGLAALRPGRAGQGESHACVCRNPVSWSGTARGSRLHSDAVEPTRTPRACSIQSQGCGGPGELRDTSLPRSEQSAPGDQAVRRRGQASSPMEAGGPPTWEKQRRAR